MSCIGRPPRPDWVQSWLLPTVSHKMPRVHHPWNHRHPPSHAQLPQSPKSTQCIYVVYYTRVPVDFPPTSKFPALVFSARVSTSMWYFHSTHHAAPRQIRKPADPTAWDGVSFHATIRQRCDGRVLYATIVWGGKQQLTVFILPALMLLALWLTRSDPT